MAGSGYGPNTRAVEDLLEALQHLDVPQLVSLAAAGGGDSVDPDSRERRQLRDDLRGIAELADRMDAIRAVNGEIESWATSVRHWFPAGVSGTAHGRGELAIRMATVRTILDAAYATVLEDLLEAEEVEILTRAWRDVIGDPLGQPTAEDQSRDDSAPTE